MLTIRTYLFTIFIVSDNGLSPVLKKGNRVLVNRLVRSHFSKGDIVLFGKQQIALGKIAAVPGDTIEVAGKQYLIPNYCHGSCTCGACRYVLIVRGKQQVLIQQGDIKGKVVAASKISACL